MHVHLIIVGFQSNVCCDAVSSSCVRRLGGNVENGMPLASLTGLRARIREWDWASYFVDCLQKSIKACWSKLIELHKWVWQRGVQLAKLLQNNNRLGRPQLGALYSINHSCLNPSFSPYFPSLVSLFLFGPQSLHCFCYLFSYLFWLWLINKSSGPQPPICSNLLGDCIKIWGKKKKERKEWWA